ncbi:MAG: ATP-binding protein [Pseudanabaenaceae cyanobacterium bins.39]|nr:ATP-binding protein [Pseudanabaenaceae cyanobacterium bins.39]
MTKIFGEFLEDFSERSEFLVLGFSPSSMSIQQRWKNNGLSADFLGDYVKNFFPGDTNAAVNKQTEVRSAVSFIANELLENAMKYSDINAGVPINLEVHLFSDRLIFASKNSISQSAIAHFQAYIQKLLTADIGEMYVSQIEDKTGSGSGLGYLTMVMDYDAVLGWKFEDTASPQTIYPITTPIVNEAISTEIATTVTTMVQLSL